MASYARAIHHTSLSSYSFHQAIRVCILDRRSCFNYTTRLERHGENHLSISLVDTLVHCVLGRQGIASWARTIRIPKAMQPVWTKVWMSSKRMVLLNAPSFVQQHSSLLTWIPTCGLACMCPQLERRIKDIYKQQHDGNHSR